MAGFGWEEVVILLLCGGVLFLGWRNHKDRKDFLIRLRVKEGSVRQLEEPNIILEGRLEELRQAVRILTHGLNGTVSWSPRLVYTRQDLASNLPEGLGEEGAKFISDTLAKGWPIDPENGSIRCIIVGPDSSTFSPLLNHKDPLSTSVAEEVF